MEDTAQNLHLIFSWRKLRKGLIVKKSMPIVGNIGTQIMHLYPRFKRGLVGNGFGTFDSNCFMRRSNVVSEESRFVEAPNSGVAGLAWIF